MSVYVGLDCGGSSTRLLAVDECGTTLATAQSGAANLATTDPVRIEESIASVASKCPEADFVCGAFAGLLGPLQAGVANKLLSKYFPGAATRSEPDYAAALASADERTDVCVIAGTGSLVCSQTSARLVKSGGGGSLRRDEGSAFAIGRDALCAYLDDPDQVGEALRQNVRELLGHEPVSAVYRLRLPAPTLAKFAANVGTDLKAGLPYATTILEHNMDALARVVVRHLTAYHSRSSPLRLGLAGGLWKIGPKFAACLQESVQRRMTGPEIGVYRIVRPPVQGAVELARELKIGNGIT